jgi:hypothetical protein
MLPCNDVPTHLNNLYEDTVKDMSINQKEKVRDLLYKYSDIFSQNDSDFGRTTFVLGCLVLIKLLVPLAFLFLQYFNICTKLPQLKHFVFDISFCL